jgi:DNA mismatch repair protein MutS
LEYELFLELREKVSLYKEKLKTTAKALAELDVFLSLASSAIENDYTMPEMIEEQIFIIEEGRHPVLEKIQGKENFVPNS